MWSAGSLTPMNNVWANLITEATVVKVVNDPRFTPELGETFGVMATRYNSIVLLWCWIKIKLGGEFGVIKDGVPQGCSLSPSPLNADTGAGTRSLLFRRNLTLRSLSSFANYPLVSLLLVVSRLLSADPVPALAALLPGLHAGHPGGRPASWFACSGERHRGSVWECQPWHVRNYRQVRVIVPAWMCPYSIIHDSRCMSHMHFKSAVRRNKQTINSIFTKVISLICFFFSCFFSLYG